MWRIVLCASVVALLAGCGDGAEDKPAESTAASSSAVPEPDPLTGLLLPAATVNSMTSATLPDLAESADLADSAATAALIAATSPVTSARDRCVCRAELVTVVDTPGLYGGRIPRLRLATDEERAEYLSRPLPEEA